MVEQAPHSPVVVQPLEQLALVTGKVVLAGSVQEAERVLPA